MKHTPHSCKEENCQVCNGGLDLCIVCGGAEASMPTECPGRKMTAEEADQIQAGNIDFRDGKFITIGDL